MNQAVVAVLLFFLINDVIRAELPSSCLTSITGSNSVECCQLQPFLYDCILFVFLLHFQDEMHVS